MFEQDNELISKVLNRDVPLTTGYRYKIRNIYKDTIRVDIEASRFLLMWRLFSSFIYRRDDPDIIERIKKDVATIVMQERIYDVPPLT